MTGQSESPHTPDSLETRLFVDAVFEKYGYDFRNYAIASFNRRLAKPCAKQGFSKTADLLHRILVDRDFFSVLLDDLTVTVTELFRDPSAYRAVREEVVLYLRGYPEIKVWCAGTAAG